MGLLDQIHDLLLIRRREGVVVSGAQLTGPGVEHLHHLGTRVDLVAQVVGDGFGEMIQQLVQDLGFAEGHGLDHRVVLAALAFNDIGGQGPGSADETQDGGLIAHALAQATQHLTDEGHGLGGVQGSQCLHLGHRADRVLDLGALALDDVEVNAHAGQGRQDVREQDHAVGLEGVERLHRDLVGEIRVLRALAEAGVFVAQVAVDLHVPAGLAHHPDRWTLHLLTTGGSQ